LGKALLPRYFSVFFDESRHIAPDLADVLLVDVPKASKEYLNCPLAAWLDGATMSCMKYLHPLRSARFPSR
jgi:hypothetical protein